MHRNPPRAAFRGRLHGAGGGCLQELDFALQGRDAFQPLPPAPSPPAEPETVLSAIHVWWSSEGTDLRPLYSQRTYPGTFSPSQLRETQDRTVWFTDPTYGLPQGEPKEQEGNFVFRFDPQSKATTIVARDFDMPNGLCFSPDEKKLYVADSGKPNARA